MSADAVNVILGAVIERAIKPVVDAIGRQFGYLFCYKSNINILQKRVAQLKKSGNDADILFQGQRRNNEEPAESSVGWLEAVKKVIKDAEEVEKATDKLKGCIDLKGRYILSRKCTKLAAEIQTLQSNAPQEITTSTVTPSGRLPGALANESSKGYKTKIQTMDEVMKALEDQAISVIGICGLGGVGKTTMIHEVRERARNQNLFDEIAMTTVSQNEDLFKIQGDLAEMLGLSALKKEKNVIARADQLHKRLATGSKVLIILDDVWSNIRLKEVGIPLGSEHSNCKVVITSRQEGVCTDIQKNIRVHVLAREEARALFRKTTGEYVEKNNLGEIADEVADECGGLPIALLALSRALSNKGRRAWEDALTQLREGHFTSIHGMEKHVYQSIKLSYDYLAKENQSLLLLCCQHQEDAKISVEKLARYCLSLDLFEGVTGVVRARNRVYTLVEDLKSCFLLQASDVDDEEVSDVDYEDGEWSDETVKMHDVVRDVCLSIVSRVKEERDKVYMHIWKQEDDAGIGTSNPDYQKLKLLMNVPLYPDDISGIIRFLEQTRELRVLEIAITWDYFPMGVQNFDLSSAPQFLTNLRMLSLEFTNVRPGVMSEFLRLTELKILSFAGSTMLSFPHQIGQLSELKLLDLRCRYKDSNREPMIPIPSGILPKLTKLEVLFMGNHYFPKAPYYGCEGDVNEESFPGRIEELDSLTNLTALQVNSLDPMQLLDLKNFRFEKLEYFSFGSVRNFSSFSFPFYRNSYPLLKKSIHLKEVGMKWVLEDKIQSIVSRTTDLSLKDILDWTDPLTIEKFASLKKFVLARCHQLGYIIRDGADDAMHSRGGSCGSNAFMNLEKLSIKKMRNVRELCHNGHLPAGLLYKVQNLYIYNLPEMSHLWVGHTDPLCLVNLKVVVIKKCGKLECIFPHSAAKCLSQLQRLDVIACDILVGIVSKRGEVNSTGRGGEIHEESNDLLIHFPKLKDVSIIELPNLRGFYNLDDGTGKSLFNPLVMFPSIEVLNLWANDSIKTVFDFEGLEAVTKREDECSMLCKLLRIDLRGLPNLEHLCWQVPKDILIFQNLANLNVDHCGNLTYLIPSSVAQMLVNLQQLVVLSCEGMKEVVSKMNEEECGELEKKIVFRSLRSVKLKDLENLSSFCSSDQHVFEFPSLDELSIIKCPEIEIFCCQIPRVARSGMLEENVSKGEGTTKALFPKLKEVNMEDTPNFRGFYNSCSSKAYQNLMVKEGGDNLVSVAASSSLVQNLKCIRLDKWKAIKTVLDFEGFDVTRQDAHSVFNRLETIRLRQLSKLEHICRLLPKEINGFQNLRYLHVSGCHSLSYLLTSTMARMLLNLKFLIVWNCKSMKEVIKMNGDCGSNKIVFHSLRRVVILSSEKLSSFCSSELQEFDFPSLTHVIIVKCPAMTTFCCGHLTAEKILGVYINDDYDDDSDHVVPIDLRNCVYDRGDYEYNDDGKVFWKGDINETIRHFIERANRMKCDLKDVDAGDVDKDDEVEEEDGGDVGDKALSKNDLNENMPLLN